MNTIQINANVLYEMFANGYRNLCRSEKTVNDLNVFPVPDGDTGTNMIKTLSGGIENPPADGDAPGLWMKKFSKSVLLSARGNSGVILSQFIRGISVSFKDKTDVTCSDIQEAVKQGMIYAYNSVTNPVEGTMLTLMRCASEALEKNNAFEFIEDCISFLVSEMKFALSKTPDMLPALKEANVVDSGGMGLVLIFEGMLLYLNGEIIEADSVRTDSVGLNISGGFNADSILEYGYCTEFILQLMNAKTDISSFSVKSMICHLEKLGDSIVAVQDDDIVKVHIHTFTPEKVLEYSRKYGEFITLKIENMSVQHSMIEEIKSEPAERIKYAVIAVANGDGIKNYFSEIGATKIIEGGQSQNPSTGDFIDAFSSLNADHIVVLPNNSNILMTANQAAEMYSGSDIRVIPTKSVAEGYCALSMMNTWAESIEDFVDDMTQCLDNVIPVSVTRAVHDAQIGGIDVKSGMYICIRSGKIVSACNDKIDSVICMMKQLDDIYDKEVVTIFYGDSSCEDEVALLTEKISSEYPHIECGCVYGGQKIYDFYIAIE